MSENEWIEKQKQRLSQNCIIQGQFDCWLCSLGGKDRQYSTLINIHLMAYTMSEKTDSSKMSTLKNPTFTFDLTQIQVVPFP
jgi:hypothetical protein